MEKAVKNINPKIMVLLESEMWPGHLFALKKHGCKTIVINGRMTEKSLKKIPSLEIILEFDKTRYDICDIEEDAGPLRKTFRKRNGRSNAEHQVRQVRM